MLKSIIHLQTLLIANTAAVEGNSVAAPAIPDSAPPPVDAPAAPTQDHPSPSEAKPDAPPPVIHAAAQRNYASRECGAKVGLRGGRTYF